MYDDINTRPSEDSVTNPGTESYASGSAQSVAGGESVNPPFSAPGADVPGAAGARSPFAGTPAQGYPTQAYSSGPPPGAAALSDVPVPWLAGLLGFIPGVGAMYNGQFAKGIAHLAIFAVLVSLADHVNGIFGVFVAGWIFYQAFEAFHTARARRDGLPLPNAFGLNDIGERLGFGRNWPGSASRTTSGTPAGNPPWPNPYTQPPPPPPTPPGPAPGSYGNQAAVPNWVGYVPPSAFPSSRQVPVPGPEPVATYSSQTSSYAGVPDASPWNAVPYASTYSGSTPPANPGPGFATAPLGTPSGRRFPVGAVLLIVLGGVFLLSNIAPWWHLSERWLSPILLASASVWIFVRRVRVGSNGALDLRSGIQTMNLICALRLPILLMALAVMFVFQASGWLTLGQTWPLLLIVLGGLLLLERTLGRTSAQTNASGSVPPADAPAPAADLPGRGSL